MSKPKSVKKADAAANVKATPQEKLMFLRGECLGLAAQLLSHRPNTTIPEVLNGAEMVKNWMKDGVLPTPAAPGPITLVRDNG